ncbi:MAG: enoyl-CoA hydratase [Chloroflexi bacterium]|nr:MAG: enoyl-CoA hydratase [Chloroflexota bacterium]
MLRYEQRGDAAWLILNRPEVRNALARELVGLLHDGVVRASADPNVRAIVLAGAGPVFCAGADLNQYSVATDRAEVERDAHRLYDLLEALVASPKPVIARVQKAAYAGAFGLLCAADLVVASDDARFSLSEARLGLVAATIGPFVVRALGARHAKALMLLAEPFGAEEALRVGLAQRVVPTDELDNAVDAWLRQLRAGAPGAIADTKAYVQHLAWTPQTPEQQRANAVATIADRRMSAEGQEGMRSFLEKRRPAWNPEQ